MPDSIRFDALCDGDSLAQQLLGAVGQAVVAMDLQGVVTFWNRGAEQLYGWTESEAMGAYLGTLLRPRASEAADASEIVASVLAGGSWSGEFPLLHRDGHVLRVLVTDSPIRDESGAIVGIVGVSTDISYRTEMERSLRRSEERLRARFEQSDMPQLTLDIAGRITAANNALCRLLELREGAIVGEQLFDLLPSQQVERDERRPSAGFAEMIADGRGSMRAECVATSGAGTRLVLQVDLTLLRDPDGSPYAFDGHVQDLTELRHVEQALRVSEARIRVIADTAQEGIWAVDLTGRTLYANRMTTELLQRDLPAVYAHTPAELLHIDPAVIAARVKGARAGGPNRWDDGYVAPDGSHRVLRISVADLPDEHGHGVVGVLLMISDVTEVLAAQAELARQALEDPLTGLGNRTLLLDRLSHTMNRVSRGGAQQVALLFVDLDHLKEVNDNCGHAEGDDLLREVGRRIVASVRPGDTVARFGGDEFVVLCEEIDEQAARDVADRLLTVLTEPVRLGAGTHVPSASIGLALTSFTDPQVLLRRADAAMYEAKRRGRGQVVADIG